MVVLVEAAGAVDKLQELGFLVKDTPEELVETTAAEAAEAVPEALEETQLGLMVVMEVLESPIQLLELPYTTLEVVAVVKMEEAMAPEVTEVEVLGQVRQMVLMEPEVAVLVSPQVQTLEELGAMV